MSYKNYTKDLYDKVDYSQIPRRLKDTDKPFSYIPMSNVILRCDKAIIKETGEEIDISSDFKITYTYMRERYLYNKSQGKPYYEGWDSIAVILGKDVAIFKHKKDRALPINKLMEKLGLLVVLDKKTCRASHKIINDVAEVLDKVVFLNSKDVDFHKRKQEEKELYIESKKDKREQLEVSDINTQKTLSYHEDFLDPFYDDTFDDFPF